MRRYFTVLALTLTLTACGGQSASPEQFIAAVSGPAHGVVQAVADTGAQIGSLTDTGDDAVAVQQALSSAKGTFDEANEKITLAPHLSGDLENARTEMFTAAEELSKAMDSARGYLDDAKSSELADYKTHWGQGRAWWNEAVTKIWAGGGVEAPTITGAPHTSS